MPQTEWLKPQTSISYRPGGQKSKIKAQANSVPVRALFLGYSWPSSHCALAWSFLGGHGEQALMSFPFLIGTLISS